MATPQQQVAVLSQRFQTIQQRLQTTVESRQKLESQSQENESVKAEFDILESDAAIYKLIGPVLVKQDSVEANQNVARRIELLKQETEKVEAEIKKIQGEAEKVKVEIIRIQQEAQAQETAASLMTLQNIQKENTAGCTAARSIAAYYGKHASFRLSPANEQQMKHSRPDTVKDWNRLRYHTDSLWNSMLWHQEEHWAASILDSLGVNRTPQTTGIVPTTQDSCTGLASQLA